MRTIGDLGWTPGHEGLLLALWLAGCGASTAGGSDEETAGRGDTAGASGCSEQSSAPEPDNPAAGCLPDIPCVTDDGCPDGHACNLALSPPACEVLYCGGAGSPCHDESVCELGLDCHEGRCNPCDICGELCEVDFATSPEHCGCCDVAVPEGGSCVDGIPQCSPGETPCGSTCVNLDTDPSHCGACDNVAPPATLCIDGVPQCPQGETLCGTTCVNLDVDPAHCGACDNVLSSGIECVDGEAGCTDPDHSMCENGCFDLSFDDANCGACGAACSEGYCSGTGCCSVFLETEVPTTCAQICADAGMACNGSGTASHDGWCHAEATDLACDEFPVADYSCGSNPSCPCMLSTIECCCTP